MTHWVDLFLKAKEEANWTEDEQRLAKEYEQKVKDLNEEREKYRKVRAGACCYGKTREAHSSLLSAAKQISSGAY